MARPDRSDAHLPPEEAAIRAEETREYFEGLAPKRHTKPSRSEYSANYTDAFQPSDQGSIPEIDKLRDLEAHPQKLVYSGGEVVEEFMETEYYKDLNCIDKQHHTTGSGFIKIEKSNGSCLDLPPVSDASVCPPVSVKGNPATNEWIPSADIVIPVSHKPDRSEA